MTLQSLRFSKIPSVEESSSGKYVFGPSPSGLCFVSLCHASPNQYWLSILQLLKYDKEAAAFDDVVREEDIKFPPR